MLEAKLCKPFVDMEKPDTVGREATIDAVTWEGTTVQIGTIEGCETLLGTSMVDTDGEEDILNQARKGERKKN